MYDSLRLSAGGGINGFLGKAEQAPNTATIAIGIGGTGITALRTFKKTVFERVKQDNYDKRDVEKPQYKRIKFLAIDSDSTGITSTLPQLDLSDDFFNIMYKSAKPGLESKKYLDWFNKDIHIFDDANKSFSGIRQVGKYLLFKKASELYNKFKDMIMTAVTGLGAGFELNIYIMSGLAGGTGSGCFIDVCYIMQQALSDLGYAGSANVVGFFFLPDVNLSNPNFPKGGPHEIMVKTNGYAALKELDYLMAIPDNGDVYRQKYNENFQVVQPIPPVKLCHLFSTTSINGNVIDDGYNYIMNVVAEYALNFVAYTGISDEDAKNTGIPLRNIIANIEGMLYTTEKKHGVNYVYNILGASCATIPYKKIGTYLASRFFDSIKYIAYVKPSKEDVEKVGRTVGLELQSLENCISYGTPELTLDPSKFDTTTLKAAEVGTIAISLSEACNCWLNRYADRRISNIKILGRELDGYTVEDRPESVIGKIFKELIAVFNNPDLGPYYAAYMFQNAQNYSLTSVLDGVRAEVVQKREFLEAQLNYRYECLGQAQAEFRSADIELLDNKKIAYISMVEHYFRNKNEIATYNDFITLLDKIKKNLDELEANFFKKYTGIINELLATFFDNAEYLDTFGMCDDMYAHSLIDIYDIKHDLDNLITPHLLEKFNTMMLKNTDKWFDESETKIAELISDFIKDEFKDAMSKSMKQYLQEKYDKKDTDLIDCITTKIIKESLVDKGEPIFHINPTFCINDLSTHAEFILLSLPDYEIDFAVAAQKYKTIYNKYNMSILKTNIDDRISLLEFFSGIPMYAYKDLIDYEKIYYSHMSPGLHLFEGEDKDWRKLPSPIPATYVSSFYERPDKDNIEMVLKLYDAAKEAGIIVEDIYNRSASVKTSVPLDLSSMLKDGWNANVVSIKRTIDALMQCKASFVEGLEEFVKLSANQYFDDTIRDDFARKPIVVNAVAAEMEKLNSIDSAIAMAEQEYKTRTMNAQLNANFIRALLHSVIFKARSAYKCSYEKCGEAEEIILTEGNEKFESIPVYRAFLGYNALNDEILAQLNDKAKNAVNNVTDEMYEAVVEFQKFYKDSYKDYIAEAASGKFNYTEENKIINFLNELYDRIERFLANNK